jgi:hypothetical protein
LLVLEGTFLDEMDLPIAGSTKTKFVHCNVTNGS